MNPNPPQEATHHIVPWEKQSQVTQEEAEARLHREGYECFCWYDVPGTNYPKHRHDYDECLWILRGELHFTIGEETFSVKTGDRIYLPARTPHTVKAQDAAGVTYLVGRRPQGKLA